MLRHHHLISLLSAGMLAIANAQSLIDNGEFAKTLKPWKIFSVKSIPAAEHSLDDGTLTLNITTASDKPGNRQLFQPVKVETGKNYTLTFDVKGSIEGENEIVVAIVAAPGKFASFKKVPISNTWVTQKIQITPKELDSTPGNEPTLKFLLGMVKGQISFRKVSLTPATTKTPSPKPSKPASKPSTPAEN